MRVIPIAGAHPCLYIVVGTPVLGCPQKRIDPDTPGGVSLRSMHAPYERYAPLAPRIYEGGWSKSLILTGGEQNQTFYRTPPVKMSLSRPFDSPLLKAGAEGGFAAMQKATRGFRVALHYNIYNYRRFAKGAAASWISCSSRMMVLEIRKPSGVSRQWPFSSLPQ